MLKEFVTVLKYLGIATMVLVGVISCENDFRNVGVAIVDNNIFSTDKYTSEVISYSVNTERNQSNALSHYLLGVQRDAVFGKLEASIVAQLSLPETNPDFGLNAVIDSVIVDIPLLATLDGTNTNDTPKFELDSVWTMGDKTIQLSVFELGTYLFGVDPEDPTETKKYFSDDTFLKTNPSSPFYSGVIAPSEIDTMLLVKRYKYPNYPDLTSKEVYKTDTIKKTDKKPSLKIPLNKAQIKAIIQDNAAGNDFASAANFQHFFRGLYFEVLESSIGNAALMTLNMSDAAMVIYYSQDVEDSEEEDEDLNDNGITGEQNITVRTPQNYSFALGGVKTNLLNRDYSETVVENYTINPNLTIGEEKIYVQGAAGTGVVIKLFEEDANQNDIPDELELLRTKNWLINEATLTFYIDTDNATNWAPERLYLYNIGGVDNTQVSDAMPQSLSSLGGVLERNSDDEPEKYVFHITDFISEIIEPDTDLVLYDLGLKVYNANDEAVNVNDTILRDFNTNPKGLSLKGNLQSSEENRLKLEIFYSEKN